MNTIDEVIEVLQAMRDGKTIQVESDNGPQPCWEDRDEECEDELPDFYNLEYRVKPEPREWTMTLCPDDGNLCNCSLTSACGAGGEIITVREVLE